MAVTTTCDGCGVAIPNETPKTGFGGHQYCEADRAEAEAYLAELVDLHAHAAKQMTEALEVLRAKYRPKLREMPDE